MSNVEYSFDGSRGFGSPLATFDASITDNGWADQTAHYESDTQDEVVNATSHSQSNNDFYDLLPDLSSKTQRQQQQQPQQPSSLPPSPMANAEAQGRQAKSKAGSSTSSSSVSGSNGVVRRRSDSGPARESSPLRVSSDAFRPSNVDSAFATPKVNASRREQSSDRFDYGDLFSFNATMNDDSHHSFGGAGGATSSASGRFPPLTSGSAKGTMPARGASSSLFNTSLTSTKSTSAQGSRAGTQRNTGTVPSAPSTSSDKNASSKEGSRRGSTQLQPHPPTSSKANASSSAGTHSSAARKGSVSGPAPTFLGVANPPDGPHISAGRLATNTGTSNNNNSSSSGSSGVKHETSSSFVGAGGGAGSRGSSNSVKSTSSLSSRTQSDGDLRKRSSSRNAEHGGPSLAGGVNTSATTTTAAGHYGGGSGGSSGVPTRRNRSASEPSPMTDEESAYFPFGLMEMPSMQTQDTHRSPARARDVVEVTDGFSTGTSRGGGGGAAAAVLGSANRFKPFTKSPQQPTSTAAGERAKEGSRTPSASGDSPAALDASPQARPPYDLSCAMGFMDSSDDDDADGDDGVDGERQMEKINHHTDNSFRSTSSSAKRSPAQTSQSTKGSKESTSDHFSTRAEKASSRSKTSNSSGSSKTTPSLHKSPQQTKQPTPSPTTTTPTTTNNVSTKREVPNPPLPAPPSPPKHHKPAGLSGFKPLAITAAVAPPSPSASRSKTIPTTTNTNTMEKKLSTFEPVPMLTSAMTASGRRFTFDGAKRHSTSDASSTHSGGGGGGSGGNNSPRMRTPSLFSPTLPEPSMENSTSLSRSASTRAPRPPSRHAVNRAAVVGEVVTVEAETLPARTLREQTRTQNNKTSSNQDEASTKRLSEATAQKPSVALTDATALPTVKPAARRQSTRRSTSSATSAATPKSTEAKSPNSTSSSSNKPQPQVHTRYIKTSSSTASPGAGATVAGDARERSDYDGEVSPSPIPSDDDSVASAEGTLHNKIINSTLRQLPSSVRIRTKVDDAALIPRTNEPWPLRPPPTGIMISLRVFDPTHPRPRQPRMRELPDGQRQANWEPPETHYTTTLADLANYEDDDDEEEDEGVYEGANGEARLRSIDHFDGDLWANEDVDVDQPTPLVTPLPRSRAVAGSREMPSPLPPPPPQSSLLLPTTTRALPTAASLDSTSVRRSAEANSSTSGAVPVPPSVHSGKSTPTPSSKQGSVHKSNTPKNVSFGRPAASSSSDGSHLPVDGSLNVSFNPNKRYGGIVVDEVEKVRRMREDPIFTPVLDDLDFDSARRTPLSASDRNESVRGKSPLVGAVRGFQLRPVSPGGRDSMNNSNSNRATVFGGGSGNRSGGGGAGAADTAAAVYSGFNSGTQEFFPDSNCHSSHSLKNDSLFMSPGGQTVIPQSPAGPTFARIIAQQSGGHSRSAQHHHRVAASTGSFSQDSLFDELDALIGYNGPLSDRKSVVTFPSPYPVNYPQRKKNASGQDA